MKHERMRIARMTDEMINFLYSIGAKDISIRLKEDEENFMLKFESDYETVAKDKLDTLVETCKSCGKVNEMEEFYWELLGDTDTNSELSLIRMMIDDIDIVIEEEFIRLELVRKKDQ